MVPTAVEQIQQAFEGPRHLQLKDPDDIYVRMTGFEAILREGEAAGKTLDNLLYELARVFYWRGFYNGRHVRARNGDES